MALRTCPDCCTQVSTAAAACPQCGRPFANSPAISQGVRTVEATAKKWKFFQLVGFFGVIAAVIYGMTAGGPKGLDPGQLAVAILGGLSCFLLLMLGRFGAWWYHG